MANKEIDGLITDWVDNAVPGVQTLSPYVPGKPVDDLVRELGLSKVVKLASNENPLGPSEKILAAISTAATEVHRYPDGSGYHLKAALADRYQVTPDQITLGNGSNEILELVVRAFVNPGDRVMFSEHAFAVYPLVTQAASAISQIVPAKVWGHDLEAMLALMKADDSPLPRVLFIANPNNPTGTWIEEKELYSFLKQVPPEVVVVLDQAYAEYMMDDAYPLAEAWLNEFSNLLVTRTFSKAYGLSGLRIGYSLSSESMANVLNRVRQPFNTNHIAQAAALAALEDDQFLAESRQLNAAGLKQIMSALDDLNVSYIPTQANFLCFDLAKDAMPINQELLAKGVIVRPVANYGMPHWLRVSIGTREENDYFLSQLKLVLELNSK